MEKKKSGFLKNTMTFGAITGMAFIIISVLFYLLNIENQNISQYIDYAILIAGIVFGTKYFRDKMNHGSITYGKALGSGVLISLFSAIILAFYTFLFFKIIDPGALGKIYDLMEQQMMKQPNLTDQQIEMSIEMAKKFTTPVTISIGIIFSFTLLGFVFSLITSIFLKKKTNPFDEAMKDVQ
ncbi:MAG: DUF4199 domain-containing protein [Bacteroidia bacterium]|nr:DUF4199 domain-containing protein [Bacteroidia bacterium]